MGSKAHHDGYGKVIPVRSVVRRSVFRVDSVSLDHDRRYVEAKLVNIAQRSIDLTMRHSAKEARRPRQGPSERVGWCGATC
jgi:hypothetical protein